MPEVFFNQTFSSTSFGTVSPSGRRENLASFLFDVLLVRHEGAP